jgi:hypothetical protein
VLCWTVLCTGFCVCACAMCIGGMHYALLLLTFPLAPAPAPAAAAAAATAAAVVPCCVVCPLRALSSKDLSGPIPAFLGKATGLRYL